MSLTTVRYLVFQLMLLYIPTSWSFLTKTNGFKKFIRMVPRFNSRVDSMLSSLRDRSISSFSSSVSSFSTSSLSSTTQLHSIFPHFNLHAQPGNHIIRPSPVDKARTIMYICTGGTLSTTSTMNEAKGVPFGSNVDYILNEQGWPIILLHDHSLHTQNIQSNPLISLNCQLPHSQISPTSGITRVTMLGQACDLTSDELIPLKLAFTLLHPYTEQFIDSNKVRLYKLQPNKILAMGNIDMKYTPIDLMAYEQASPDVVANDISFILPKINTDKQHELILLAKHFLGISHVHWVKVISIDRCGFDLRIKSDENIEEYRIGFRHSVETSEDAKSELTKLFHEVWERENGFCFVDYLPPIMKYNDELLRHDV